MSSKAAKSDKNKFECLCFDLSNKCVFGTDCTKLSMLLKANVNLFPNDIIESISEVKHVQIKDQIRNLTLNINRLEGSTVLDYTSVFFISAEYDSTTPEEVMDGFRFFLVSYLVKEGFGKIYITRDDFSSNILERLYPKINRLENLLRSYITKHFSISEGVSSWFKQILDGNKPQKVDTRKANEDVFSTLEKDKKGEPLKDDNGDLIIDTRIFLTDFGDIGSVIYANSFGNLSASDLIERIKQSDDITDLQQKVQRNIDRFFGNFKDIDFQRKWEFLTSVRNKIAHNGLISLELLNYALDYTKELTDFIESIDQEKIGSNLSDVDDYIEIEKRDYSFSPILDKELSKNDMLKELALYESWSKSVGRNFYGLKNFLYNRLGGRGYNIGRSWDLLEEIEKDGYIKIYTWTDKDGQFPDQKAIEVLKPLPVYSV